MGLLIRGGLQVPRLPTETGERASLKTIIGLAVWEEPTSSGAWQERFLSPLEREVPFRAGNKIQKTFPE